MYDDHIPYPEAAERDGLAGHRATVLREIAAERERQISREGWTPAHDDTHQADQMAMAAAIYATPPAARGFTRGLPDGWPWDASWWKPKDRRRDLIRAAALIVAEIERLDRAAKSESSGRNV